MEIKQIGYYRDSLSKYEVGEPNSAKKWVNEFYKHDGKDVKRLLSNAWSHARKAKDLADEVDREGKTLKFEYKKMKEMLNKEIERHFRPEFLNRLDAQIVFKALTRDDLTTIVEYELNKVFQRLVENGLHLRRVVPFVDRPLDREPDAGHTRTSHLWPRR